MGADLGGEVAPVGGVQQSPGREKDDQGGPAGSEDCRRLLAETSLEVTDPGLLGPLPIAVATFMDEHAPCGPPVREPIPPPGLKASGSGQEEDIRPPDEGRGPHPHEEVTFDFPVPEIHCSDVVGCRAPELGGPRLSPCGP